MSAIATNRPKARRDAKGKTKPAAAQADAVCRPPAEPAAAAEAAPQAAAADTLADGALRARDKAAADLETEAAKLGDARLTLAKLERDRERLADELAAGSDARPAYAAAVLAVEEQSGIVRALTRRCAKAEQDLAAAEAALATARRAGDEAELERLWEPVERHADELDGHLAGVTVSLGHLVAAGVAFDHLAGRLHGSPRWGLGVGARDAYESAAKDLIQAALPKVFRVLPLGSDQVLPTILDTARRQRRGGYERPAPITVEAAATPPPVAVDRSDPTGGEPDPAWLRDQDRRTAEARRPAPEPLLK